MRRLQQPSCLKVLNCIRGVAPLKYAVSNMAVAVGFSDYVNSLLDGLGIHIPKDFAQPIFRSGIRTGAYFNVVGFLVVMVLTVLLVRGIRESAGANSIMVAVKITAILIFIFAASRYVHPANWKPFMPNGWQGVLTGGAIVFFTYIGFDSRPVRSRTTTLRRSCTCARWS